MAYVHCRSNSLPPKLNPIIDNIQDHLCRLKSSQATSTSTSSVLKNLNSLRDLQECINNMIQLPTIHQVVSHRKYESWTNGILEGSIVLMDLCEFSRDVMSSTKEYVQELESSVRRNRGETAILDRLNAYKSSRKKTNKRIKKHINNLKSFKINSTATVDMDYDTKAVAMVLKETENLSFAVLNSVLMIVSGTKGRSKQRSWLSPSRSTQESGDEDLCSLKIKKLLKGKHDFVAQNVMKQLKESEMIIQELEKGLEAFFRSLVKTRVSLLNILSH